MGGIWTEVIPNMACDCMKPNIETTLAVICVAAFEYPRLDVIADAANPKPDIIAVVHPTPDW